MRQHALNMLQHVARTNPQQFPLARHRRVAVGGPFVQCVNPLLNRGALVFGLITPHGLIELTAVLIAGAAGLKIGWTVIDPGARSRSQAVAEEFRSLITVTLGLVIVLLVAGLIEGFVTPSGLPTAARVTIGVIAELGLFYWIGVYGRRANKAGITGDLDEDIRGDVAITV